jgi:hypothetical protein
MSGERDSLGGGRLKERSVDAPLEGRIYNCKERPQQEAEHILKNFVVIEMESFFRFGESVPS